MFESKDKFISTGIQFLIEFQKINLHDMIEKVSPPGRNINNFMPKKTGNSHIDAIEYRSFDSYVKNSNESHADDF